MEEPMRPHTRRGARNATAVVRQAAERRRADEAHRTEGTAERAAVERARRNARRTGLGRWLYDNGLTIAAFAMFAVSFGGQIIAGQAAYNEDRRDHGQSPAGVIAYITSGAFISATAENWESEFLQLAVFVVLTACLVQRGSSESKGVEEPEAVDQDPREARNEPGVPWPVRRGGIALRFYSSSLSIVLFSLFVASFLLHAAGGSRAYNAEQREHGTPTVSMFGYMATGRFWFESFQNWQSEFLSVGVLVLLTIWLRQYASPQSKPVAAPHHDTGE
jgi:uncharacterized protein DUF6766